MKNFDVMSLKDVSSRKETKKKGGWGRLHLPVYHSAPSLYGGVSRQPKKWAQYPTKIDTPAPPLFDVVVVVGCLLHGFFMGLEWR